MNIDQPVNPALAQRLRMADAGVGRACTGGAIEVAD
jgi:hypothetical protein